MAHTHIQRPLRLYPSTILLTSFFLSIFSPITANATCVVEEQEFLVTAYYSPLPTQQRYAFGSFEADVRFNGSGIRAADGTKVYPGMIAAPSEYPFGTVIEFPRLQAVGTVHDRGGRIVTGEDGIPRIDLWMGHGEEGLARALEWGARRLHANVYFPKPRDIPDHSFALEKFPAPEVALKRLPGSSEALKEIVDPRFNDTSPQVAAVQHTLTTLEYFDHDLTGYYGPVTRDALKEFMRDAGVITSGEIADDQSRNLLIAHRTLSQEIGNPLPEDDVLLMGASGKEVRILQRMLMLLGLYEGEIDGIYDQEIMRLVYNFQIERGIVQDITDTGAGMIGPQTHRALLTAWRQHRIKKRGGSTVVAAL